MAKLTKRQIELIRHCCCAGTKRMYRNYYSVAPGGPEESEWLRMVETGFAERTGAVSFRATHAGKAAAGLVTTVAVFEHPGNTRAKLMAYTRDYNTEWPGCCLHLVEGIGAEAKRLAMAEHREKCMGGRDE